NAQFNQTLHNQTSGITALPPTPESALPPARLAPNEAAGPGLTAPAGQSRRANAEPLVVRPQVARADQTTSRDMEAYEQAKAAPQSSAPVIGVTMGRMDVRAVSAPPPPPRRPSDAASKLSLEEYLRSRSGRKG